MNPSVTTAVKSTTSMGWGNVCLSNNLGTYGLPRGAVGAGGGAPGVARAHLRAGTIISFRDKTHKQANLISVTEVG